MPAELFVASGMLAAVLLALLALTTPSENGAASDETALAKRYIDARIEEHIAALAARYAQITAASGHDDSDRFRLEVESFIAQALQRDLDEPEAAELRDSVREVLVLEREWVYDRVLACVRAHRAER
jgi:hypothetical protein